MSEGKDNEQHGTHLQPVSGKGHQLTVYDPSVQQFEEDDTIDLREYWRVLVKRRWTVLGVVAIVVTAALLSTLLMIPEYRSTAQVQISPQSARILEYEDFSGEGAGGGRSFQEFLTTQFEILRSRSLSEKVVEEHELADHPELAGEVQQRGLVTQARSLVGTVLGAFRGEASAAEPGQRDPVRAAAKRLRERVEIQPVRNSHLVNVSVTAFDPQLAAEAANALVQEYIESTLQRRYESGSEARQFLEGQLEDMRIALERSDQALMDFARENNVADLEERLEMSRESMRSMNDRLNEVQAELVTVTSWKSLIEQGRIDNLEPVVEDEALAELESQLVEAETEYAQLSETFLDSYPAVEKVQSRIDNLKSEIEQRKQTIVDNILGRHENLQAREQALKDSISDREQGILALNERAVQYNILKREFETNRELYDGLLQRMKEIGVAAGVQENNIAVIDQARVAAFPFSPSLPRNLALALVLGLFGGVGLALLLEFLDGSVRRVEDIERLVDRPVLGMVPLVKLKGRDGKVKKRPKRIEKLDESISHYSAVKPTSGVSESFRSLRTSLSFATPEGMPRTLMFTSAAVGEGKTTAAINLATVIAQNGQRVLLIDADLRKPRIHREFNCLRAPGLTNRIARYENTGQDNSAIHPTHTQNLFIMPAGNSTPNPAEMLSSERLARVIDGCKRAFDHVIIDAPPTLGLADALTLSRQVDGVIFVAMAGQTAKENFRVSMKRLAQVQSPVLGVVLNGVDLDSPEYAYYSSYYYSYEGDDDELGDGEGGQGRIGAS
ncbi:GumC family protein [Wenzhouxiangella sediminis]|uniref:non-specific protein-tyrosine kinase n=1 Tax=Wenzhouxiangella sediminis TaxID=1792836 RepID=A0A3E1KCN9_9GAMM|nr:polysaccharide biosynthesis tyrosine autokinase [Wenzhouxiangella sediminis]RFF32497.1 polysaccharide biosynthesis tyrosine autokinase [Wenzhouxiangella sediminis]